MRLFEETSRMIRSPFRIAKATYLRLKTKELSGLNERSNAPVVRPGGPVVCLTSYGRRVETAFVAIESIARGSLLPSELILWLDDESVFRSLPITLQRLKRRGLTIRLSKNYGPHTKYYPYIQSHANFVMPLVTADDDIIYPRRWLEVLTAAFERNPSVVSCYRARTIGLRGDQITPYAQWTLCRSTKPSWRHLLNGVSGVIYPQEFLKVLRGAGSGFEQCCPRADDLWLHATALRAGFKVRQIGHRAVHFPMIPGTQESALYFQNMAIGNDIQIAKTYTQRDVQRIAEE